MNVILEALDFSLKSFREKHALTEHTDSIKKKRMNAPLRTKKPTSINWLDLRIV